MKVFLCTNTPIMNKTLLYEGNDKAEATKVMDAAARELGYSLDHFRFWMDDGVIWCDFGSWSKFILIKECTIQEFIEIN